MSHATWAQALDAFEARLAEQEQALSDRVFEGLQSFEPPPVSTPFPLVLADRATSLLERCRALEHAIATALAETAVALARSDNDRDAHQPREPVYFDTLA